MFPQFCKNPLNTRDVSFAWGFDINKYIIEINNDKNIKLLGQNLINIILEARQYVREPQKYYLVLELALLSLESCFLFIAFFNTHLIVSTYEIKLGELFGLT